MSKPDHDHVRGSACCEPPDRRPTAAPVTTAAGWLHVPAMDCVTEESEIRRALDRLDGIRALTFRLSERNLHIDAAPAVVDEAADLLRRIGFDARLVDDRPETPEAAAAQGHEVVIWLQGEAANIANKNVYDKIQGINMPPMRAIIESLVADKVPVWVCEACGKGRNVTPENWLATATYKNMGDYVSAALAADKSLQF